MDALKRLLTTGNELLVYDSFIRPNNALLLGSAETGQTWTANRGTPGILSNQAYFASDTDDDLATIQAMPDGILSCSVLGDINSPNFSLPDLVFRQKDASNWLQIRPLGGVWYLQKVASGSVSNLASANAATADNTLYDISVSFSGADIAVYRNSSLLIVHALATSDLAYATYAGIGIHLRKSGTPGYAAKWSGFRFGRW